MSISKVKQEYFSLTLPIVYNATIVINSLYTRI